MAFSNPAEDEEGGSRRPAGSVVSCPWSLAGIEKVEDAVGVLLHSGLEGIPIFRMNDVGERVNLEVVFHVDGQGVKHRSSIAPLVLSSRFAGFVLSLRSFNRLASRGLFKAFSRMSRGQRLFGPSVGRGPWSVVSGSLSVVRGHWQRASFDKLRTSRAWGRGTKA